MPLDRSLYNTIWDPQWTSVLQEEVKIPLLKSCYLFRGHSLLRLCIQTEAAIAIQISPHELRARSHLNETMELLPCAEVAWAG
jgi:hypothetical protein